MLPLSSCHCTIYVTKQPVTLQNHDQQPTLNTVYSRGVNRYGLLNYFILCYDDRLNDKSWSTHNDSVREDILFVEL